MKWTTKQPDRPGHWWHRYAYGDEGIREPEVWKIRNYAGKLAYNNCRIGGHPKVAEEWSDEPILEPE